MNRRAPAEQATKTIDSARTEVEALQAALAAAEGKVSDAQAQIAALTLMIEKLRRALYGRRSERFERLLGQLELELDELTASATEDELAAETAPGCTTKVKGFERRRPPSRNPSLSICRASAWWCRADGVHVLRVAAAVEGRRRPDRDAGGDSAPVEGD